MEQQKIGENIYKVKDFIDITDDVTKNQAQQSLLQNMRTELLKQINGVNITSTNISQRDSSGMVKFDMYGTEEVDGIILDEKVILEKKSIMNNKYILEMEVQMEVGKQKGEADQSYKMKVEGLKSIYNHGDKLNINIETTRDSYIYIFIKDENDMVYEYYPNVYQKENFLLAKSILKFPDNRIFDIELNTESNKDSLENIIVLASKEPINFLGFKYDSVIGLSVEKYKDFVKQLIVIDKSLIINYLNIYKILGEKE